MTIAVTEKGEQTMSDMLTKIGMWLFLGGFVVCINGMLLLFVAFALEDIC